jgi:hypothetical protein
MTKHIMGCCLMYNTHGWRGWADRSRCEGGGGDGGGGGGGGLLLWYSDWTRVVWCAACLDGGCVVLAAGCIAECRADSLQPSCMSAL